MTFATANRPRWYQSRLILPTPVLGAAQPFQAQYGNLAATNTAWAAADKALFIPFTPAIGFTVTGLWYIGGTATPNSDIGIYLNDGTLLVSTGVSASANGVVSRSVSLQLRSGVAYYWALMLSATTAGGVHSFGTANSRTGILQASTQNPLATGPTFAVLSGTNPVPVGGIDVLTG